MPDIKKDYFNYRHFFLFALIIKAIYALIEITGSIFILFIKPEQINRFIIKITAHEISEDPKDFIANYLLKNSSHLTFNLQWFWSAYLLLHGIIKIFLITMLLKKKLWSYPIAIVVFSLFLIYQIYLYITIRDFSLILISVLDILVIYMTWREYLRIKSTNKF